MSLPARRLIPLAVAASALIAPCSAYATATANEIEAAKQGGVGYLKSVQQVNGEFPGDEYVATFTVNTTVPGWSP